MNDSLIKRYLHEIEWTNLEMAKFHIKDMAKFHIKDSHKQKNPHFGFDPSTDNFLPQKSTDCG